MLGKLDDRSRPVIAPSLSKYGNTEIESGRGVYLYDGNGKRYLDFAAGIGVANTGHCHPEVVSAIQDQASKLIHACAHVSWYPPYIELAEKLAEILPVLGMMCFGNSGTEAVEAAIKMGRYVSGRPAIIAFQGSFHGRTLGAASLTGRASLRRKYEPLLPSVYHAPYPYCFRCAYGQHRETCHLECFQGVEKLFESVVSPDEVGTLIIEPILGEGGYYVAPDEFLVRLRELCNKHSIFLVVDEVQSGMGRTGKMFSWQHIEDFVPDVMTLAKGLGSGMPIGAVMARPEIMSKWERGSHGSTFGGNPVSCSAAIATLKILEEEHLLSNAENMGRIFRKRLSEMSDRYSIICDVRGRGLMNAIEIAKPDLTPDQDTTKRIIKKAAELGLLIISGGIYGNVLRFIPPLTITEAEVLDGLEILERVLEQIDFSVDN